MSSKLDKSAIVAGAGFVASIFTMLVREVRKAGGTDEDIHRLSTPGGEKILADIAKVIVGGTRQIFRVTVDYGKSLAVMISAGKYDWVNDDITRKHFPVTGQGAQEVEVVLFCFNKVMTSGQVIAEMDKTGYRPAKIEEFLALGASQPELQKQFPIICLGSVWRHPHGYRDVPGLDWYGAGRRLHLDCFGRGWVEYCRFAGARK